MKRFFGAILKGIQAGEMILALASLTAATLLIIAQVLNRYWLRFEIMWLSDLALYAFIFFMFTAFAAATWKEGHVSVDLVKNQVFKNRPVWAATYRVFLVILSMVILGSLFFPLTPFMKRAIQYPEYGTLVRWFNTSWLMIWLFIAFVLVMIHLFVLLRRDLRELAKAKPPETVKKG
ncbi:MAG: TRAP transporter small permease subunit [Syntrophaceae bacterium]|nr:TRAP transporter small permease subunit [Syntrophaceae bacterium]